MFKVLSRWLFIAFFLAFVTASIRTVVYGQVVAQTTTPPAARPPDLTAFATANALKDPMERLAALRKFKTDFPGSGGLSQADNAILDTLITSFPDRKDEINKAVDAAIANISSSLPASLRMAQIQNIVLKLTDKRIALDKAEAIVGEAMEYVDRDFKKTQAQGVETLGVIYLAKGDTKRAEKNFNEAIAANDGLTRAPVELAQLEAKRGNDTAVVNYLMPLALMGKLKPAEEDLLRTSYERTHNGSASGLDADLDKLYRARFPNPVKLEAYKPTPARTSKIVLAEMFTGSGCQPCVGADVAFDAVAERYAKDAVITIAYHLNIPASDPMVVAGGDVRRTYYKVGGVPTLAIDGTTKVGGGITRDTAPKFYGDYVAMLDKALETAASAKVSVLATILGTKVQVSATTSDVRSDAKDLKLQVVLVERELRFTGENGIRFHPMVVRGVAGENQGGFDVKSSGETTVQWTFDLTAVGDDVKKTLAADLARRRATDPSSSSPREYRADGRAMAQVNPAALTVVAFVQETKGEGANLTRQVLNAAQTQVITISARSIHQ